jgi:photosystem II stability/assembly factor-like uncharacterized protein
MNEQADLKDRLERLADSGNDPGREWFIATVRHARARGDYGRERATAIGRRPLVSLVAAFVAVVVVIGAVAFVTRSGSTSPTPRQNAPVPSPTASPVRTASVSAGPGDPALVSASEGWICDRILLHTIDGGARWSSIALPLQVDDAPQCEFLDHGRAWVALSGNINDRRPRIIRIVAGAHPAIGSVTLPGTTPQTTFASVTFTADNRGWALTSLPIDDGNRQRYDLYATADGGLHWNLLLGTAPITGGLTFVSPMHGWAVDGDGVRRTDDGGRDWTRIAVPLPSRLSSLRSVFVFGHRIVAYGVNPRHVGLSLATAFVDVSNDGGRTWSLRDGPAKLEFVGDAPPRFVAVDPVHWRAYQYGIWLTNDAGASWNQIGNQLFEVLGDGSDGGMSFVTPERGWVTICKTMGSATTTPTAPVSTTPSVGNPPCHPLIAGTTDGGRTWREIAQL